MEKEELKELLIKCWMTHDGMWFLHCLQECGIEKTNEINKAAVKSLAKVEIKRIQKAFNIQNVNNFKDLQNIVEKLFQVFKAEFMKFDYNFPEKNLMHFKMHKCFAYNGIKQIGVIDRYICGIYDRIEGWFSSLKLKYTAEPKINGCLKHSTGECSRDFKFFFNN
jgi:hypothetical protein